MAYLGKGAANTALTGGTQNTFSGSPSMSGSLTAAVGDVTATNGNLVASTAAKGVVLGGGAKVICGTGDPGGAVTAPQGSLYLRLDGGAGTRAYINTNSGTTWTAVTTAG